MASGREASSGGSPPGRRAGSENKLSAATEIAVQLTHIQPAVGRTRRLAFRCKGGGRTLAALPVAMIYWLPRLPET
jgi:hypothetical protein